MKAVWCAVVVLAAAMAFGQLSPGGPGRPSGRPTPDTFPGDKGKAPQPATPAQEQARRAKIEQQIEKTIRSDRRLNGANVKATVEDSDIVMTGTVKNDGQRRLALHMAEAYADGREIIDKLVASR